MATVVAFNAHPDDETLVMGGTLAKLAAAGHRVLLVVATDGMMRGDDEPDPRRRLDELQGGGAALGASEVRWLGYADSGQGPLLFEDPPGRVRLARAGVDGPAARLADILREESAALLVGYDAAGGYRHRDHLAVHAIARRAAELTGVRLVEATLPREIPVRVVAALARVRLVGRGTVDQARTWYTPSAQITHRIDVRGQVPAKQRALAAHRTELAKRGLLSRALRLATRVPSAVIGPLIGTEFFVDPAGRSDPIL